MKKNLRDLVWILPVSLCLGLALSLLSQGTWWISWVTYTLVLSLGLAAISKLWRSVGAPRTLLLMLVLAGILRLGLGIAFSTLLPVYGNDTRINQGGYAVRDAYSYDFEAWKLASSGEPLWRAFDRSYKAANQYDDQYGGLLFLHSLGYRFLSPDEQRPWLLILFSSLSGAIGVGLAWKGACRAWGESVAWLVGWILALYPESLMAGASAVREPFLILFTAMAFLGVVELLTDRHARAWVWLAGGISGLLVFSPGVAAAVVLVLGIWVWLNKRERLVSGWWFVGLGLVVVLAVLLLGVVVGGALQVQSGPLVNLVNWLRFSALYGAHITIQSSGWLQTIFQVLPESLQLPFITAYGLAQPVLPAAIADPAVWPMRALGILRGLGWYALLPLLLYSLYSILNIPEKRDRLAWLWLWLFSWVWIIISAARAGGDQWDNPRYRLILLLFQAALAAQALTWQRLTHDRWLGRFLAVEGVFLVLFGYWYISRYAGLGVKVQNIFIIFAAIAIISAFILIGSLLWDRRQTKRRQEDTSK